MTSFTLRGVRRDLTKRVRTEVGTSVRISNEPDGHETADIELVIDLESLAHALGRDAMANRSSRAILAGGLVKAFAINKKRVQP